MCLQGQQTKANQRAQEGLQNGDIDRVAGFWWPCVHASPIWTWNFEENEYWSVNLYTIYTPIWLVIKQLLKYDYEEHK